MFRASILEYLLYLAGYAHVFISPFTKVEESFNVQACHDLMYHRTDLQNYDHHQFPGVVPRTFVGPLVLSFFGIIITTIFQLPKLGALYTVRCVLSTRIVYGVIWFCNALSRPYSRFPQLKSWLILVFLSQFHFLFYSSRPLPNILALVLVLPAFSAYAQQNTRKFVLLSAASILVFRAELAVLLGLMLLYHLAEKDTFKRLKKTIINGLVALAVYVPVSVVIDSYFWKRWLWPELEVLYFNTVLNKSHEWGVMPFAWYFYSALPRSLLSSFFFLLLFPFVAKWNEFFKYFLPPMTYVFLYSFLPHKELRFIIYTLPLFNFCAAAVYSHIWTKRNQSLMWKVASYGCAMSLLSNVVVSCVMTYVSSINYPGGQALVQLHQHVEPSEQVRVHLDVASCQTGISRFLESNPSWIYDKTENLSNQELIDGFTHLLVLKDDFQSEKMTEIRGKFKWIAEAKGLDYIKETFPFRYPRFSQSNSTIYVLENIK